MSKVRAKLIINREQLGNLARDPRSLPYTPAPIVRNTEKKTPSEDALAQMYHEISRLVESFKVELRSAANQHLFETRDCKLTIPKNKSSQQITLNSDSKEIERWLTKVCSETFSLAFEQYRNGTMPFNQAKIFCSENILRNIALLSQQQMLTPETFELMDRHLKEGILKYMMTKYPLTESTNINKKLASIVKQIDNYQRLEYDFFYNSNIVFEFRESGNYNDLIMKVINAKLKEIDEVQPEEDIEHYGQTNFKRFEHYFTTLFEKVEDEEWVNKRQAELGINTFKGNTITKKRFSGDSKEFAEGLMDFVMFEEEKKKLTRKEKQELEERQRQKKAHLHKYREKVKQYTHFLIGRKINENVVCYTQKQIESLHLVIKHQSILRILTKWCEQLWTKFETKDYYLNNHEQGLKVQRGGNVNTISLQLKQSLSRLMQEEKVKIDDFMKQLAKNNYEMQESLLKKQLENEDCCTYMDPLEKACGVFSIKVVNNLHNYIITYLNRLIHGLMAVSNKWFQTNRNLLKAEIWPSPPNLLTLKIGDIMRCKCESKESQIISIYQHIVKESRQRPEQIKIIRLKNRLKQSTNDVLLNVRLFNKLTCEVQLSIQAPKSHFLQHSNHFSHFLYELKRSVFGPISELCSIWSSLDQRRKIYQQFLSNTFNEDHEGHQCEITNKAVFRPFQRPFICSVCKIAYSHNYYVTKHVKCLQCNYWRCARCQLELMDTRQFLQNVVEDQQVLANCIRIQNSNLSCSSLPQYGFCIFKCAKVAKVEYFNLISIKNRPYLFGLREGKVYEVAQINIPSQFNQFLHNYMIFGLPPEIGKKVIKIDRKKANHQYLLVKYKNQVFSKERESLCLQDEGLNDASCELIFSGEAKEKENIKHIDLQQNQLTSVRFICEEFPNLKILQLSSNRIEDFNGIQRLEHLQKLYLGHYPLREGVFPENICRLAKLQTLIMQNVSLFSLPSSMQYLSNLTKLELGSNKITTFPSFFEYLTKLKHLSFFSNQLGDLPSEIGRLVNLESLILSDNLLSQLPCQMSLLTNLKKLDIQSNHLSRIAFSFRNLLRLQQLNLSNNKLQQISEDLGQLQYVQNIDLSHNRLRQLPDEIEWRSLLILNASHNEISHLNQSFYRCGHLFKLQMGHNKLKEIDEKIGNIRNLSSLNLANNQLECWSAGISQLDNLVFLSMSSNNIGRMCPRVGNLSKLEFLYASANRIETIPPSIRRCVSLKQLYLNDNLISSFPEQLAALQNIEQNHLDLSENPVQKVLCLQYVLAKGDYMTRTLVRQKMSMELDNEEERQLQDLDRIKQASRKRSLRARRGQAGQCIGRRSTSNNK